MAISEKMRKKMEARKKDLASKGGAKGVIFFKDGKTRIRPLPVGKDADFAQEVITFYINEENVISPATFGEPCAIYEKYQELKKGDDEDKETAEKIKPRRRFYSPSIKYKDEKGKEYDKDLGPALAILTNGVYEAMVDLLLDDEGGDFMDEKEGYDIKVQRSGSGMTDTKYSAIACKPSALPKELRGKTYDPEKMVRDMMITYEESQEIIDSFFGKKKKKKKSDSLEEKRDKMKKKKKKKKVSDA